MGAGGPPLLGLADATISAHHHRHFTQAAAHGVVRWQCALHEARLLGPASMQPAAAVMLDSGGRVGSRASRRCFGHGASESKR